MKHCLFLLRFCTLTVLLTMLGMALSGCQKAGDEPIKIGILHSLSGTMATSEKPVVDATLLAIEEINAKGGLLGRQLVPVIADGKSDDATFAAEAMRLITQEKVAVVFGCWTSSSRKTVKPIFEKYHSLLFYPVQHEGLEQSPNIIYTGAVPNQQIIPAISWTAEHLGKRLYLVGSDYIFPRMANRIIKKQAALLGLDIVGEAYLPLGAIAVDNIIENIKTSHADVVINSINGDSNISFFHGLAKAGLSAEKLPVLSFSIGENELAAMADSHDMIGDYAAWSYFQSIQSTRNKQFIRVFKARFGQGKTISDPMEAAYVGVNMWAQAVDTSGTTDVASVLNEITIQTFDAPEGIVAIDHDSRHTWRSMRIGQVSAQGGFNIVWTSEHLIHPEPYPLRITPSEAQAMLQALYHRWGQAWVAPPTSHLPINTPW